VTKRKARSAELKRAWKKIAGLDERIENLGIEISLLKKDWQGEKTDRQIAELKKKREALLFERRVKAAVAKI
jgi:hypothetical protein